MHETWFAFNYTVYAKIKDEKKCSFDEQKFNIFILFILDLVMLKVTVPDVSEMQKGNLTM